ncbi:MAG: zinc ribbon domain-containing protein [Clostridia bacterium]|nr:zinc ribbon domain-containing protein [Clostridia bacterium]
MDNFCTQCGNPLNGKNKCDKCGHITSDSVIDKISHTVKNYDYKGKAEQVVKYSKDIVQSEQFQNVKNETVKRTHNFFACNINNDEDFMKAHKSSNKCLYIIFIVISVTIFLFPFYKEFGWVDGILGFLAKILSTLGLISRIVIIPLVIVFGIKYLIARKAIKEYKDENPSAESLFLHANKRIILSVLMVCVISVPIVNKIKTLSSTESMDEYTTNPTENVDDIGSNKYYSCLVEKDNHLEINVTVQAFLNNYNRLKKSYENKDYKDLTPSDFFFIEEYIDTYGASVKSYGCSQTIFGTFDDLVIALDTKGDKIYSISFGIKNNKYADMYYSDEYFGPIMINYQLLISSVTGCDMNTSKKYVDNMFNNKKSTGKISTYDKGLAFIVDTSQSKADWYRIIPCTEKEYKAIR